MLGETGDRLLVEFIPYRANGRERDPAETRFQTLIAHIRLTMAKHPGLYLHQHEDLGFHLMTDGSLVEVARVYYREGMPSDPLMRELCAFVPSD